MVKHSGIVASFAEIQLKKVKKSIQIELNKFQKDTQNPLLETKRAARSQPSKPKQSRRVGGNKK